MKTPAKRATKLNSDSFDRSLLEFVRHVFSNHQELIRFMDQKASYSLAAIAALVTLMGIGLSRIPSLDGRWTLFLSGVSFALAFVFAALVAATMIIATQVYRARGKDGPRSRNGLIFPLEIQALLASGKTYSAALAELDSQQIVQEYASQIEALARVYESKQAAVNSLVAVFSAAVGTWFVAVLFLACSVITNGN